MKSIKFLILILILSLSVLGCGFSKEAPSSRQLEKTIDNIYAINGTETKPSKFFPKVRANKVTNKSKEEISAILLKTYFEHYKSDDPSLRGIVGQRLIDYKVRKIKVLQEDKERFMFMADFDVKPTVRKSDWVAGNGIDGSNGWIVNKALMFYVEQAHGSYKVLEISTGLVWPNQEMN